MRKTFYCPTCKKEVSDIYQPNLSGISLNDFLHMKCDTPVVEMESESDKDFQKDFERFEKLETKKDKIEIEEKVKKLEAIRKNEFMKADSLGMVSMLVGAIALVVPIYISWQYFFYLNFIFFYSVLSVVPGIIAILLGKRAILMGARTYGEVGAGLGILDFIYLAMLASARIPESSFLLGSTFLLAELLINQR